jgi:integrase
MPQRIPRRRKMRFGFTAEEIVAVLGSVNRNSRIGKRDYAIMLIAARTGLRACDIASLKLTDIDWRSHEIRIVQQKTGVALSFPLSAEVGNAIIDYFFNARRGDESPYIFPLSTAPRKHIKSPTITALTAKYMRIADIDDTLPYRGVHSFRRSFGKRLLDAHVAPDMLMELLGQVDVNSITPYTAIHEDGLRRCALPLESVKMEAV